MKNLFLPFLAALTLAGCSNDEPVESGNDNGNADTHYLAVSIVSTPNTASRAAGDQYPGTNGTYEDGLDKENTVTSVRFYFFNSAGDAVTVKQSTGANYYDWTNPTGSGADHSHSVEKQLEAVLLIETAAGDKLPAQIIAVVNPNTTELGTSSLSRETLRSKYADYAALANAEQSSFVMTNSVYMDASGVKVLAQAVTTDNYKTNADAAKAEPVVIYVERNVAKVRVKSSLTTLSGGFIKATDKEGNGIKVGSEQVYVKLDGWNVTGTLQYGYLSKHINSAWQDDYLGANTQWNYYQLVG